MALRAHTHTHTHAVRKEKKTDERAHSLVQQVGVCLVGKIQIEHRALEFEHVRRCLDVSEQLFVDRVVVSVFYWGQQRAMVARGACDDVLPSSGPPRDVIGDVRKCGNLSISLIRTKSAVLLGLTTISHSLFLCFVLAFFSHFCRSK